MSGFEIMMVFGLGAVVVLLSLILRILGNYAPYVEAIHRRIVSLDVRENQRDQQKWDEGRQGRGCWSSGSRATDTPTPLASSPSSLASFSR